MLEILRSTLPRITTKLQNPVRNNQAQTVSTLVESHVKRSGNQLLFSGARPLFGQDEVQAFEALKQQAARKRAALPILVQMQHPVSGDVGIEQMNQLEAALQTDPVAQRLIDQNGRALEQAFLDSMVRLENVAQLTGQYYSSHDSDDNVRGQGPLTQLAELVLTAKDPSIPYFFFEKTGSSYNTRRAEPTFSEPLAKMPAGPQRDTLIESLVHPEDWDRHELLYLSYTVIPLMSDPVRRDNVIKKIAMDDSDYTRKYAIDMLPLVSDPALRHTLAENIATAPVSYYGNKKEMIPAVQYMEPGERRDQVIAEFFVNKDQGYQHADYLEAAIDALQWMSDTDKRNAIVAELTDENSNTFYQAGILALKYLPDPEERDNRIAQYAEGKIPVKDQDRSYKAVAAKLLAAKIIGVMSDTVSRDALIEKLAEEKGHEPREVFKAVLPGIVLMDDLEKRDNALESVYANIHKNDYEFREEFGKTLMSLKNPTERTKAFQNAFILDSLDTATHIGRDISDTFIANIEDIAQRNKLIEDLCEHPNSLTRRNAGYAVRYHSDVQKQVELLKKLFTDPDMFVKDYAGYAVRHIEDPAAHHELVKTMLENEDPVTQLKTTGIQQAVNSKDPEVRKKYILEFAEATDSDYKPSYAARAIAALEDRDKIDEILDKLSRVESPYGYYVGLIKCAVAESAKHISNPEIRNEILERLSQNGDRDVRVSVCKSLDTHTDAQTRIDILERFHTDQDWSVTRAALPYRMKHMVIDPMNELIDANPDYMNTLNATLDKLDPEQRVPRRDALSVLNTLVSMGNDAGKMQGILAAFHQLRHEAIQQPDLLPREDKDKPRSPERVNYYFKQFARPILMAILVFGSQMVRTQLAAGKMPQMLSAVNDDVMKLSPQFKKEIQELVQLPGTNPDDAVKLPVYLEYLASNLNFNLGQQYTEETLHEQLAKMKEQGQIDLNLMTPEAVDPENKHLAMFFKVMVLKDYNID